MSKTKKSKNQNEKGETKMENIVQWNPSEGYLKLDEENVNHYYFEKFNDYDWNQEKKFENEIEGELSEYSLFKPYEYKDPKIIRVSTDNDLFFGKISDRFISKIFQIMNDNPQHTFKLRTKYSKRLAEIENYLTWSENIHMGVIVEEEYALERIEHLRKTAAKIKYIIFEPLLGPLNNLNLEGIDFVYIGDNSRNDFPFPIQEEWLLPILDKCREQNVTFRINGFINYSDIGNSTEKIELTSIAFPRDKTSKN